MSLADIQSMKALKLAKQSESKLNEYVWNTDKGLRKWNIARAIGFNGVSNVVVIGDSICDSTGASARDYGYVGLVRNAIQLSTGLAGHGFVCNNVIIPDGTWSTLNEGTNLKTLKATPSSSQLSFKDFVQYVDVIYAKKTDGGTNATIKVDNITQGNISCNGSTSYHNVQTYTVNQGVHSIQISPATDGNTYIEGVVCRSGNSGVLVHQVGHGGISANDYRNNTPAIVASISAFNPLLTIIELGTNDAGNQVSISNYSSALDQMVKNALTTGDCLIVSMVDRSDGNSLSIPYSQYVEAAKKVAIDNSCAHLNLYERWNKSYSWANDLGLMSDTVHPSQIGHTDIANAIIDVLKVPFPTSGVFQLHSDAVLPYGDIAIKNANRGSFRVPSTLGTGQYAKGNNVSVTQGITSITITNAQPDTGFIVMVVPSWNTSFWITNKTYAGFTVNFGTAAPAGATIDWYVSR